jgi:hypothetical protein
MYVRMYVQYVIQGTVLCMYVCMYGSMHAIHRIVAYKYVCSVCYSRNSFNHCVCMYVCMLHIHVFFFAFRLASAFHYMEGAISDDMRGGPWSCSGPSECV